MKTSRKTSNRNIQSSHMVGFKQSRTFQLTVAGLCLGLLLLLNAHMVARQNHINHADSKLAHQKLPLGTIPQGSQGGGLAEGTGEKIEINE